MKVSIMKHVSTTMLIAVTTTKGIFVQSYIARNLVYKNIFEKRAWKSCLHIHSYDNTLPKEQNPNTNDEHSPPSPRKGVCFVMPENIEHRNIANEIASKLGIPILVDEIGIHDSVETEDVETYKNCLHILPYKYLSLESYAISIQPINDKKLKSNRKGRTKKSSVMQPFFIDFCPPSTSKLGQRLGKQNQKGSESLLKAVSPFKLGDDGNGAIVFDFNAGFGQDSIIMALGGARKVHMVERDPIVGLLLADAMRRLELISCLEVDKDDIQNVHESEILRARDLFQKLSLYQYDSIEFAKSVRLHQLDVQDTLKGIARPDVCYLDPMFPPRTKSSAVKKNMQILHGLFKHDEMKGDRIEEEKKLLKEALMLANKRVVVKRPAAALPLGFEKDVDTDIKLPSYSLKGSVNRFDVYII